MSAAVTAVTATGTGIRGQRKRRGHPHGFLTSRTTEEVWRTRTLVLKSLSRQLTVKTPYYGTAAVGPPRISPGTHLLHASGSKHLPNTPEQVCASAKPTLTHLCYEAVHANARSLTLICYHLRVIPKLCADPVDSWRYRRVDAVPTRDERRNRRLGPWQSARWAFSGPNRREKPIACVPMSEPNTPTAQQAQLFLVNSAHSLR